MKAIRNIFLALAVLPLTGFADGSWNVGINDAAPAIIDNQFAEVESMGTVIRVQKNHPYTEYTLGLPVKVGDGSACNKFVGIQTIQKKDRTVLKALGTTNPLIDACIQIYVMPTEAIAVYKMKVLTGGFVPAARDQERVVEFAGKGKFLVHLDMSNDAVTIHPVIGK